MVEGALDGEMDDHLGYEKHDAAGRNGGNSRNGYRAKTVITEAGPVELSVPRDRDSSFEPKIVAKRQRRLAGVYGAEVSKQARRRGGGEVLDACLGRERSGELHSGSGRMTERNLSYLSPNY